jgi:hypothetical protein
MSTSPPSTPHQAEVWTLSDSTAGTTSSVVRPRIATDLDPGGLLARPQGRRIPYPFSGAIAAEQHPFSEWTLDSSETVRSGLVPGHASSAGPLGPLARSMPPTTTTTSFASARRPSAELLQDFAGSPRSRILPDHTTAAGSLGPPGRPISSTSVTTPLLRFDRAADPSNPPLDGSPPTSVSNSRGSSWQPATPSSYHRRALSAFDDDPALEADHLDEGVGYQTPASVFHRRIQPTAPGECSPANSRQTEPVQPASDQRRTPLQRTTPVTSLPEGSVSVRSSPRPVPLPVRRSATTPPRIASPRLASSAVAPHAPAYAPSRVFKDSAPFLPLTASEVDRSANSSLGRRPSSAFSPRQSPAFMPPPPASPVSAEGARLSRPSPAIPASSKVPGPRSAPTRSTELGQSHPSPSEPSLSQSLLATRQMESARMYLPQRAVPAPVVPCDRRNSPESYDPTGHVTSHMSGVDQYTSYPSPLGGRPRSAPRICSATGVSSPNQDAARHRHSADVPVHRQPHRRPEELKIDQSRQVTIVTRNAEFTRSPQHFDPRSAEVHPSGPSYRSILPPATLPHYQSHHHRPEEPLRHDPRNDADQTWYAAEYSRSPQPYMSRDEQINLEFSERRSASVADFPQRPVTRSATRTRPVSNLADPRRMDSSSDARRTTQLIGQDQRPNGHVTYVQPANEPLFYEGQPELRVTSRPTQLQLETSQAALIAETVDAVLRKLQATPLSSPHATDTNRSVPMAPPAAGRVPSPEPFRQPRHFLWDSALEITASRRLTVIAKGLAFESFSREEA